AAVWVQEHQIGRGPQVFRLAGIGPDLRLLILAVAPFHKARGTDINDIVVVLNRLVGRDRRRINPQRSLRRLVLRMGGGREAGAGPDGHNGSADEHRQPEHDRGCTLDSREEHGSSPSVRAALEAATLPAAKGWDRLTGGVSLILPRRIGKESSVSTLP